MSWTSILSSQAHSSKTLKATSTETGRAAKFSSTQLFKRGKKEHLSYSKHRPRSPSFGPSKWSHRSQTTQPKSSSWPRVGPSDTQAAVCTSLGTNVSVLTLVPVTPGPMTPVPASVMQLLPAPTFSAPKLFMVPSDLLMIAQPESLLSSAAKNTLYFGSDYQYCDGTSQLFSSTGRGHSNSL